MSYLSLLKIRIQDNWKLDLNEFNWFDIYEEYEVYLENYERRMIKLIDTIERFGSKSIIVSHSANAVCKPTICNTDGINNKQYNGVDYYYFKNILNSKIEEICKMRNVPYIDIDDYLTFDLKYDLYDTMHNTPSGSKKIDSVKQSKIFMTFLI